MLLTQVSFCTFLAPKLYTLVKISPLKCRCLRHSSAQVEIQAMNKSLREPAEFQSGDVIYLQKMKSELFMKLFCMTVNECDI